MSKKRIPSDSKRRLIVFGTISIVAIIYFVFSVVYYTMDIYHLQKEKRELANELNNLRYNEKLLKTEIDKLKDPEYLARYARENYLYSKDGEIVIRVQKENEVENKKVEEKKSPNVMLFGGIIIGLVFLYVSLKKWK